MCNAWNHPPGCTCGWGGEGSLGGGSWSGGVNWGFSVGHSETKHSYRRDRDDDYCRPTTCPRCGADVFFVRHNGGSVWFDDLGIPWPKHACFDGDAVADRTFSNLNAAFKVTRGPVVGLVVQIRKKRGETTDCIVIQYERHRYAEAHVYPTVDKPGSLVGQLVVVSRDDNRLIHLGVDEYRIRHMRWDVPKPERDDSDVVYPDVAQTKPTQTKNDKYRERTDLVRCPRCIAMVRGDRLEKHLRNAHGEQV